MRDDFGGLFAASPASLRRDPTPAEVAGGLACGAAGRDFWNEMLFTESSILAELNTILDAAGVAPDESRTDQLKNALIKLIPAASGSPFNYKLLSSPTRTVASAASAGQQVPVLSNLIYPKTSDNSKLAITLGFFSYSPVTAGQGNGAATARLVTSTPIFKDFALNNSLLVSGAPVGAGYNTPTITLEGLPSGNIGLGLTYRRDDSALWNTIFNPNNSDFGGITNTPVSTLFCWEFI